MRSYLLGVKPEGEPWGFTRFFSDKLSFDSSYHNHLDNLMRCVARNAKPGITEQEAEALCGREWRGLKIASINDQLRYHNVNAKHLYHDKAHMASGEIIQ